jgi:hypothetical protein
MPKQLKRGTIRGSHKAMDYQDLPVFRQKLAANPNKVRGRLRSPSSR